MTEKKLNNLLSFTEHSDKYKQPSKKTKRTDVAKDILESNRSSRRTGGINRRIKK